MTTTLAPSRTAIRWSGSPAGRAEAARALGATRPGAATRSPARPALGSAIRARAGGSSSTIITLRASATGLPSFGVDRGQVQRHAEAGAVRGGGEPCLARAERQEPAPHVLEAHALAAPGRGAGIHRVLDVD